MPSANGLQASTTRPVAPRRPDELDAIVRPATPAGFGRSVRLLLANALRATSWGTQALAREHTAIEKANILSGVADRIRNAGLAGDPRIRADFQALAQRKVETLPAFINRMEAFKSNLPAGAQDTWALGERINTLVDKLPPLEFHIEAQVRMKAQDICLDRAREIGRPVAALSDADIQEAVSAAHARVLLDEAGRTPHSKLATG